MEYLILVLSTAVHTLFGFGPSCRFTPTCSQYMKVAVRNNGPVRGSFLGLRRLLRCHPFTRRYGLDELSGKLEMTP